MRCAVFAPILIAIATPALAAAGYEAIPVKPPAEGRMILRDVPWTCAAGRCLGPRTGSSTDAVICAATARSLGQLTRFVANGSEFSSEELEKCNRSAR